MTTLCWDLVGGNPTPGEPGAFRSLADDFSATAEGSDAAHRRLTQLGKGCDDSIWRGEPADAFRATLKGFCPMLQKLHHSYATASTAMGRFAAVLADLQPEAGSAVALAQEAGDDERACRLRRDEAVRQQATSDPLLALTAPFSTTPFDQAVDQASARVREARARIDRVRERYGAAEKLAVRALQQASEQGIKNDPWYRKAIKAVDRWVDRHADALLKMSNLLRIGAAVAGLLSSFPPLAPVFLPIAVAAAGTAAALDTVLVVTGNGQVRNIAVDVALMANPARAAVLLIRPKATTGLASAGGGVLPRPAARAPWWAQLVDTKSLVEHHDRDITAAAAANGIDPNLLRAIVLQEGGYRAAGVDRAANLAGRQSYGIASIRPKTAVSIARRMYGIDLTEAQAIQRLSSDDAFSIKIAAGVLRANIDDYGLDRTASGALRPSTDTNYAAFMSYALSPRGIETSNEQNWDPALLRQTKAHYERAQFFEYWRQRL